VGFRDPSSPLSSIEILATRTPEEITIRLIAEEELDSEEGISLSGLDRYEVLEELGRGGMGIVFKARHRTMDRVVALKVIRCASDVTETRLARFMREGRTTAALQHPNIVKVFEFGKYQEILYMAMEFIPGSSVAELLEKGPLKLGDVFSIMDEVLSAVGYAHSLGFVHRDLKPSNILLDETSGRAKLIDFGLVKRKATDPALTTPGKIVGTPYYLSPELLDEEERDVDARSDIFSLGIILYEMLSGRRPFDGETPVDILAKIVNERPKRPAFGSLARQQALWRICLKALEKDPDRRFTTAREFADALQTCKEKVAMLASSSSGTLRTKIARKRARTRGQRAILMAAALASVVLLALLLLWAATRGRARRTSIETETSRRGKPAKSGLSPSLREGILVDPAASDRIRGDPESHGADPESQRIGEKADATLRTDPLERTDREEGGGEKKEVSPSSPSGRFMEGASREGVSREEDRGGRAGPREEPRVDRRPDDRAEPAVEPRAKPERIDAPPRVAPVPRVEGIRAADDVLRLLTVDALACSRGHVEVANLCDVLQDSRRVIRHLALRGLSLQAPEDLRSVGGKRLLKGLLSLRPEKGSWAAETVRCTIEKLMGLDPGEDPAGWRRFAEERRAVPALPEGVVPTVPKTDAPGALKKPISGESQLAHHLFQAREVARYLKELNERPLEIAFLLDVTSSMADEVNVLRRESEKILFALRHLVRKPRLGLVTYGNKVLAAIPLQTDPDRFLRYAKGVAMERDPTNRTIEEAVDQAFRFVLTGKAMRWHRRSTKLIILLGDAPPPRDKVAPTRAIVAKARKKGFTVNAVMATPPERFRKKADPEPFFREITREGGGTFRRIPSSDALAAEFLLSSLGRPPHEKCIRRLLSSLNAIMRH
jgi:serine/threonine protein kinase